MTAKEFLQQVYFAQQEVEMKLEQIERLQSLATRITTRFKSTPSGSNSIDSRIEISVAEIQEQINRLSEEVTKLLSVSKEVQATIAQVEKVISRRILEYRYLSFFTWKQIAIMMRTSLRHVYKLHKEALENFSTQFSKCH